jgi:Holliday junction resolvase
MTIRKSSRHQKIIGDFGEHLIANWLSRSGFEVVLLDHTGMDIVAYHSELKRRIGITVKSRTRSEGTEKDNVTIFSDQHDRQKVIDACEAFGCEPWIGIYVEMLDSARALFSLLRLDERYLPQENLTQKLSYALFHPRIL